MEVSQAEVIDYLKRLNGNLELITFSKGTDSVYRVNPEIKNRAITIKCKTNTAWCRCPYCGTITDKVNSTWIKRVRGMPIRRRYFVFIEVEANIFICYNEDCKKRKEGNKCVTFSERFNFIIGDVQMTYSLSSHIKEIINHYPTMNSDRLSEKLEAEGILFSPRSIRTYREEPMVKRVKVLHRHGKAKMTARNGMKTWTKSMMRS